MASDFFFVNWGDISRIIHHECEELSGQIELDWHAWRAKPSSLVIPTMAVGIYYVRRVLTPTFAALFSMLKDLYTVAELAEL